MAQEKKKYKIKLQSGRVLGPIELDQVKQLIINEHIKGNELARIYPDDEWKNINQIKEINELLLSYLSGELKEKEEEPSMEIDLNSGQGDTVVLSETDNALPGLESTSDNIPSLGAISEEEQDGLDDEDVTLIGESIENPELEGEEETKIASPEDFLEQDVEFDESGSSSRSTIHQEETIFFEKPKAEKKSLLGKITSEFEGEEKTKKKKKTILIAVGLMLFVLLSDNETEKEVKINIETIRPTIPELSEEKKDPQKSKKFYQKAMLLYLKDNVVDLKSATQLFHKSIKHDPTNVKALAMLASTYLNLIDSSNKDEKYFSVITKIIEMSRAKSLDLPETIIADIEFYLAVNRGEAAQNRLVEYTKTHKKFGLEMFYYLAYAFYKRGDLTSAARYISQIPDNKAFSPKVFFLKGMLAEKFSSTEEAIQEYTKALKIEKKHAKSRLRIVQIYAKQGKLNDSRKHLESIIKNPERLSPVDLASAYYHYSRLNQLLKKEDKALKFIKDAVRLDKNNHEYRLEYYTLAGRAGKNIKEYRKSAQMYYFIGEGEKLLAKGDHENALTQFLSARQSNPKDPLPLLKIGDMFYYLNNLNSAALNYEKAAKLDLKNKQVWAKYVEVLIKSYEWEKAKKAMETLRKIPKSRSSLEKLKGDFYARQGLYVEAITYYKRAMSRKSIDSDVYIAYANSLMAVKQYKYAPFFFSLAQRFDPLNFEAIIGIAKATAETKSIDEAIVLLQDELQRTGGARAEIISAIAELQIQKGDWGAAQISINQAKDSNPSYARPWGLQADIYLKKGEVNAKVAQKALEAYQSYIDRNSSDAQIYLERYKLYMSLTKFEDAAEELANIFRVYPKYPGLHFYRGHLYSTMGNNKAAIAEYQKELEFNPNNLRAMVSLGKELVETGGAKEALSLFNKVMQRNPRSAGARLQAGYANFKLKNYAGAIALYKTALRLDKGNPEIYKKMGIAYRAIGDQAGASHAFRKYLELAPDAPDRAQFQGYR